MGRMYEILDEIWTDYIEQESKEFNRRFSDVIRVAQEAMWYGFLKPTIPPIDLSKVIGMDKIYMTIDQQLLDSWKMNNAYYDYYEANQRALIAQLDSVRRLPLR